MLLFKAVDIFTHLSIDPISVIIDGCKANQIIVTDFYSQSGWANPAHFKAPLSPRERDEQRWLSSYFFIRTGDSSSSFPESVMDQRAQRFIHHESQLHRLFILLGRPTSEARPIKFSHSCPNACHFTHINRNTLSFSLFVSRYSSCPIYLDFSISASLPRLLLHHFSHV